MSLSYRVCLILPEGNPHPLCFREVGLLLVSALKSNGLDCDFTFNQLSPDRINIILGYHLLTFEEGLKNYRYIPYQLEQLHSEEFPFSRNMELVLRHAWDVWDYSEQNICFLRERGIEAKFLVPGYHPNLEMMPSVPRQTIDVLFYGSIGERRKKVLDELSGRCKVKVLFGVYGEKRDQWIARSGIVLNVHHYSTQIFEAVRISYLLNNRCFVLSEKSVNYSFGGVDLPMEPYESLVESCMTYLGQPERLEEIRAANYEAYKSNYPMTDLIKRVLK
jgi:hypothetical protein